MLTLRDPIEHARRLHRDRVAVIDGETQLRYGELAARCARLSDCMRRLGLERAHGLLRAGKAET